MAIDKTLQHIMMFLAPIAADETNYYEEGFDEMGCPINYGNYDDVYNDGFDNGVSDGRQMLANTVMNIIKEQLNEENTARHIND